MNIEKKSHRDEFSAYRAGSIIPNEDETFSFGASDLTSLARRESAAFNLKRRGTATTYNSKESVYGLADATSMEKLSDKVNAHIFPNLSIFKAN